MSVDAGDLPVPVQRALAEWANQPDHLVATALRTEASRRIRAASSLWGCREWVAVIEQLAIAQGYLVASMRVEEGD